jgi:hypothetical protein
VAIEVRIVPRTVLHLPATLMINLSPLANNAISGDKPVPKKFIPVYTFLVVEIQKRKIPLTH